MYVGRTVDGWGIPAAAATLQQQHLILVRWDDVDVSQQQSTRASYSFVTQLSLCLSDHIRLKLLPWIQ